MVQPSDTIQNIAQLVERELGVHVQETERTDDVGATAEQLAPLNPKRVAIYVINLSANTIFIRPGREATTTAGIRLSANGGFAFLFWKEDLTLPGKEWFIIADAAGSAYYVMQMVMY